MLARFVTFSWIFKSLCLVYVTCVCLRSYFASLEDPFCNSHIFLSGETLNQSTREGGSLGKGEAYASVGGEGRVSIGLGAYNSWTTGSHVQEDMLEKESATQEQA